MATGFVYGPLAKMVPILILSLDLHLVSNHDHNLISCSEIHFCTVRGVKVVPEFDAPAHVGNGWQFAEKNHPEWGKLAVCVNKEEWQDYCVEPPCGQVS